MIIYQLKRDLPVMFLVDIIFIKDLTVSAEAIGRQSGGFGLKSGAAGVAASPAARYARRWPHPRPPTMTLNTKCGHTCPEDQ